MFTFTGWGVLVFFDTEEHQIDGEEIILARIPRLGAQWKIIFDAKFEGIEDVWMLEAEEGNGVMFNLSFNSSKISLTMCDEGNGMRIRVVSDQIAKVGEWTRIEITHEEEEDGKYFLFMSVEGKVVGKEEVAIPRMERADVHVSSYGYGGGILRRLVVLEK